MSLIRGHVEPVERPQNGRLTLDAAGRNSKVRVLQVTGRPRLMQRLAALEGKLLGDGSTDYPVSGAKQA